MLNGKLDLLIDSTTQLNLNQIRMFELLSERSKDVITKEMGGEKTVSKFPMHDTVLSDSERGDDSDSKPPITKEVILFDTRDLKRFTLEQLQVLRQQIGWELQERLKKEVE